MACVHCVVVVGMVGLELLAFLEMGPEAAEVVEILEMGPEAAEVVENLGMGPAAADTVENPEVGPAAAEVVMMVDVVVEVLTEVERLQGALCLVVLRWGIEKCIAVLPPPP